MKNRVRALLMTLALVVTGLAVTPEVAPVVNAAPAAAGWCDSGTPTTATNGWVEIIVPSIGVGGSRNCQMSYGSVSNGVMAMQASLYLCESGVYLREKSDGAWGPTTDAAFRAFQGNHHITVDGVYGPQSHNHMYFADVYWPSVPTGYDCGYDYAV